MSKRIFIKPEEFINRELVVSEHAISNWNERVDVNCKDREAISKIIKQSAESYRVNHEWGDFYIVNNDIVLCVVRNKEKLIVNTVYGRKSNVPALNNVRSFIRNKKFYGKVNLNIC